MGSSERKSHPVTFLSIIQVLSVLPFQYSCLENPLDREAWGSTVHGVAKSWTQLKQLSMHISLKSLTTPCLHSPCSKSFSSLVWVSAGASCLASLLPLGKAILFIPHPPHLVLRIKTEVLTVIFKAPGGPPQLHQPHPTPHSLTVSAAATQLTLPKRSFSVLFPCLNANAVPTLGAPGKLLLILLYSAQSHLLVGPFPGLTYHVLWLCFIRIHVTVGLMFDTRPLRARPVFVF